MKNNSDGHSRPNEAEFRMGRINENGLAILKKNRVTLEQYQYWLILKYNKLYNRTGYVVCGVLSVLFIYFGIHTYLNESDAPLGLLVFFVTILHVTIILPIYWFAIRRNNTKFKNQPLVEIIKNNLDHSYFVYYFQPRVLQNLSENKWEIIRNIVSSNSK